MNREKDDYQLKGAPMPFLLMNGMSPLIKIPCLLLVTAGLHRSYTSPNAPRQWPAEQEDAAVPPSLPDTVLRVFIKTGALGYFKACFWCWALAESVVITANAYPSFPLSKVVLEHLILGGDVSQIRFTAATTAGLVLGIAGTVLRVACYNKLGKEFTYEMSVKENHRLVTTGPYNIVRHPSYAGSIMVVTSIALLHETRGSWLRESGVLSYLPAQIALGIFTFLQLSSLCFVLARMKDEDEALRRRFGDEWETWAARVRYLIIPGLF